MNILSYLLGFIGLVLAQVLIFNQVLFLGYLNPYLYILFILYLPLRSSRALVLIMAFALGAIIDIFENSSGIHAAASVLTAFVRPLLFKTLKGSQESIKDYRFSKTSPAGSAVYFFSLLFIHHLVLFLLESFGVSSLEINLLRSLYSSLFTYLFTLIYQFWKHSA